MLRPRLYIPTLLLVGFLVADYFFILEPESQVSADPEATPITNSIDTQAYVLPALESTYYPILNSRIPEPRVDAQAFLVFDTDSGRTLYSRNADIELPIASLTKIVSAMVILDNYNLNDIVTVASGSVRVDGEKQDLYLAEELKVIDLLQMMLIQSSNDAAYALLEHGKIQGLNFVQKMNEKASDIGMKESLFLDPAGLDDGAYSTAKDLKQMIEYSRKNYSELWSITRTRTKTIISADEKFRHDIVSTNKLFDLVPAIEGGKTGYTEGALGCMILITQVPNDSSKIVTIVLGSTGRFADTNALVTWIFKAYRWK